MLYYVHCIELNCYIKLFTRKTGACAPPPDLAQNRHCSLHDIVVREQLDVYATYTPGVSHLDDTDADSNADSDVLVLVNELLNFVFHRIVAVLQKIHSDIHCQMCHIMEQQGRFLSSDYQHLLREGVRTPSWVRSSCWRWLK